MTAASKQLKILLVEDDLSVALATETVLTSNGYAVETVHDGLAALEVFASSPTDVVITDLKMPLLDGREFISRLRAEWPFLPVVVVTGYPPDDGVAGLQDGSPGSTLLLEKPVRPERLLEVLDDIFAA